jgi:hypothetical protein
MGFNAAALEGGYTAWLAAYPTEPKGASCSDGRHDVTLVEHI